MRPPGMTTRRWMIAVAVVGIVIGVTIERRNRFRKIAADQQAQFRKLVSQGHLILFAGSSDDPIMRRLEWHESMRLKYERAARYPWLSVDHDPPEPEKPFSLEDLHNIDVPSL
jgi:hypothetical protein